MDHIQIIATLGPFVASGIGVYIGLKVGQAKHDVQITGMDRQITELREEVRELRRRLDDFIDSRGS